MRSRKYSFAFAKCPSVISWRTNSASSTGIDMVSVSLFIVNNYCQGRGTCQPLNILVIPAMRLSLSTIVALTRRSSLCEVSLVQKSAQRLSGYEHKYVGVHRIHVHDHQAVRIRCNHSRILIGLLFVKSVFIRVHPWLSSGSSPSCFVPLWSKVLKPFCLRSLR